MPKGPAKPDFKTDPRFQVLVGYFGKPLDELQSSLTQSQLAQELVKLVLCKEGHVVKAGSFKSWSGMSCTP